MREGIAFIWAITAALVWFYFFVYDKNGSQTQQSWVSIATTILLLVMGLVILILLLFRAIKQ